MILMISETGQTVSPQFTVSVTQSEAVVSLASVDLPSSASSGTYTVSAALDAPQSFAVDVRLSPPQYTTLDSNTKTIPSGSTSITFAITVTYTLGYDLDVSLVIESVTAPLTIGKSIQFTLLSAPVQADLLVMNAVVFTGRKPASMTLTCQPRTAVVTSQIVLDYTFETQTVQDDLVMSIASFATSSPATNIPMPPAGSVAMAWPAGTVIVQSTSTTGALNPISAATWRVSAEPTELSLTGPATVSSSAAAEYTVTLASISLVDTVVTFAFGGSATKGTEYDMASTLTIPAGQLSAKLVATIAFSTSTTTLQLSLASVLPSEYTFSQTALAVVTVLPATEIKLFSSNFTLPEGTNADLEVFLTTPSPVAYYFSLFFPGQVLSLVGSPPYTIKANTGYVSITSTIGKDSIVGFTRLVSFQLESKSSSLTAVSDTYYAHVTNTETALITIYSSATSAGPGDDLFFQVVTDKEVEDDVLVSLSYTGLPAGSTAPATCLIIKSTTSCSVAVTPNNLLLGWVNVTIASLDTAPELIGFLTKSPTVATVYVASKCGAFGPDIYGPDGTRSASSSATGYGPEEGVLGSTGAGWNAGAVFGGVSSYTIDFGNDSPTIAGVQDARAVGFPGDCTMYNVSTYNGTDWIRQLTDAPDSSQEGVVQTNEFASPQLAFKVKFEWDVNYACNGIGPSGYFGVVSCTNSLCTDSTTWVSEFGNCDAFRPDGAHHDMCSSYATARQECPLACGVCNPIGTNAPTPAGGTSAPTTSEIVWPDVCQDNSLYDAGYGGCGTYSEQACSTNNPLCNNNFCNADGADYYCPVQCNSCNVNDATWFSEYGDCASYAADKCTGATDCNFNHCAEDKDKFGVLASVACKKACNTGPVKPQPPGLQPCYPDSTTFDVGYGSCSTYGESECGANPNCNFQYCDADGAAQACPTFCKSCSDCVDLPETYCSQNNLCFDSTPVQCNSVIPNYGSCFCDASCTSRGDCCPGRNNACLNAQG
jgi:hypothetical protein